MWKEDLIKTINEVGVENCLFIVPMRPVHTAFGLFSYTSSSDQEHNVPAKITEERYKIKEGYKITLESIYKGFGKQHFYLCDFVQMIDDNRIEFYVRKK